MSEYLKAWREFKDVHPEAYTAAAVTPFVGSAVAVADYADAMDRGDSVDGATAAASIIPGVKLAKYGSKMAPAALRLASKLNPVEKTIAPVTKRADKVGKAMNVEQVGEYAGNQVGRVAPADANKEVEEFHQAWMTGP